MKSRRRISNAWLVAVQAVVVTAFGLAYALASPSAKDDIERAATRNDVVRLPEAPRTEPLSVAPLYDRPDVVSDEELAAVLRQVQPRFSRDELKPNFVEHALRVWGVDAEFADPEVLSGREMLDFLTNNANYTQSWKDKVEPLLDVRPTGIAIRYGADLCASVHHDHWLACLTEAGVRLDTPVYGPGRQGATIADVLHEALRDFRLDERETEWTAMAFGFWLSPTREWTGSGGRRYSFDLLAERLLRGDQKLGVCSGTHRVYSLAVLLRLDDDFDILTDDARARVYSHLERVRDEIMASQFEDGHWPTNWPDGAEAVAHPIEDELHQQVIATGHHLEWLAIAPRELHPPDEQIRKAARWAIDTTVAQSSDEILKRYTFFSHIGNALALWRSRRPAEFWQEWERLEGTAGSNLESESN
jgi:hypothetical protein